MSIYTDNILKEIMELSNPSNIVFYTKFFRACKGDICEGDKLLAIKIPKLRKVIKKHYKQLDLGELQIFVNSQYNEVRFFGHQIIKEKYNYTNSINEKSELINFLIDNYTSINHWNLVDAIAPTIGNFWLITNQLDQFQHYSNHSTFWVRRIAIVACLALLRTKNKVYIPIVLSVIDNNKVPSHEYINKAIGWILREVGKLDEQSLIQYLQSN